MTNASTTPRPKRPWAKSSPRHNLIEHKRLLPALSSPVTVYSVPVGGGTRPKRPFTGKVTVCDNTSHLRQDGISALYEERLVKDGIIPDASKWPVQPPSNGDAKALETHNRWAAYLERVGSGVIKA